MDTRKTMVIQDYDDLNDELKAQVKDYYPKGYAPSIVDFTAGKIKNVKGLRFETADKVYMLRLSNKMINRIMEEENVY